MSARNVEVARGAVEAVERSDWDGLIAIAAPDFEIDLTRANGPINGVFSLQDVRAMLDEFAGNWQSLRFEHEELIDVGGEVVVPWTMYAGGRDGIEVISRVTWVWSVRGGAISRATMYQEREDALEAVGAD